MPTLVRFRFNKLTGEVEEFLVDDQDRNLSEAEHDRIAADVGRFVAQNPRVVEVVNTAAARPVSVTGEEPTAESFVSRDERPEVE